MKNILTALLLCFCFSSFSQIEEVADWQANYDETTQSIIITADIKGNWVIYSQNTDPYGPVATTFEFDEAPGVSYDGPVEEVTKPIEAMSELFGVTVRKFKEKAEFKQKLSGYKTGTPLSGNVTFMACDNEKCLPPRTIPFEVKF